MTAKRIDLMTMDFMSPALCLIAFVIFVTFVVKNLLYF